jgi:hypothetical protein
MTPQKEASTGSDARARPEVRSTFEVCRAAEGPPQRHVPDAKFNVKCGKRFPWAYRENVDKVATVTDMGLTSRGAIRCSLRTRLHP